MSKKLTDFFAAASEGVPTPPLPASEAAPTAEKKQKQTAAPSEPAGDGVVSVVPDEVAQKKKRGRKPKDPSAPVTPKKRYLTNAERGVERKKSDVKHARKNVLEGLLDVRVKEVLDERLRRAEVCRVDARLVTPVEGFSVLDEKDVHKQFSDYFVEKYAVKAALSVGSGIETVESFACSSVVGQSIAFNAGGPVWGLDFCPVAEGMTHYLAVGCKRRDRGIVSSRGSGPNLVQLWNMGNLDDDFSQKPFLDLAFLHNGGVVWSMKWCPLGAIIEPCEACPFGRLGLLACGMADGSLSVWSIPFPSKVREHFGLPAGKTVFLSFEPVWTFHLEREYVPSVDWKVTESGVMLLCGATDGVVRAFEVDASKESVIPFFCRPTGCDSIWSVSWDPLTDNFFMCVGSQNHAITQLWCLDSAYEPLQSYKEGAFVPRACLWMYTNKVMFSTDTGIIGLHDGVNYPDEPHMYMQHDSDIHDVASNPFNGMVATCSTDGAVHLCFVNVYTNKGRSVEQLLCVRPYPRTPEMEDVDENTLLINTDENTIDVKGYTSNQLVVKLPPEIIGINRISWGTTESRQQWLAAGGSSGLVIVKKVVYKKPVSC